jgi:hypothetical protein
VIEIEPGTLSQVKQAQNGRMVLISDDAAGIAADLRAIDRSLRLRCADDQSVYIVYQALEDGEKLVTTSKTLDARIVQRVREIAQPGYDLVGELHKAEAQDRREHEHKVSEQVGDVADKLAFAIRKDLSRTETPKTAKSRAFLGGQ